jgi:hypothetical protein
MPISIGGGTFVTDAGGMVQLLLPWGRYAVSVPDTVAIGNGTRARFIDWSDRVNSSSRVLSVGNNVTIGVGYGVQHELTVYSPFAAVNGGGWYFENTEATVSVSPTSVPVGGLAGWLGARYIFDHWTGACTGTKPQCNIFMKSPERATAIWRVDWSRTELAVCILIAIAALWIFLRKRRNAGVMTKTPQKGRRESHSRRLYYDRVESFIIGRDFG